MKNLNIDTKVAQNYEHARLIESLPADTSKRLEFWNNHANKLMRETKAVEEMSQYALKNKILSVCELYDEAFAVTEPNQAMKKSLIMKNKAQSLKYLIEKFDVYNYKKSEWTSEIHTEKTKYELNMEEFCYYV